MEFSRPEYIVGSLSLLQWIFLTQGWNWGFLHYRWILYQLSYEGSPKHLMVCVCVCMCVCVCVYMPFQIIFY